MSKTHEITDLPPAIAQKIEVDALGHWIWTGNYHPDGQPLIGSKMAHSTIYRYLNPDIDHLDGRILRTCKAIPCVNPAHMRFPQADNGGIEARNTRAKTRDGKGVLKRVRVTGGKFPWVRVVEVEEGVEKVESVEKDAPNNSDLVKVLQRIAEVLERIEVKVK